MCPLFGGFTVLPPTGGKQRHRLTIATEHMHTCLLPRLFFDDNGHSLMSPTLSGCSLVPRPSPPPMIACKNWRRARAENEAKYNTDTSPPWNVPIYSTLSEFHNFYWTSEVMWYCKFSSDYNSSDQLVLGKIPTHAFFTIWTQIYTVIRIKQSTQL